MCAAELEGALLTSAKWGVPERASRGRRNARVAGSIPGKAIPGKAKKYFAE